MTDPLDLGLELECKYCDYQEIITVPEADYISWHNGEYIQDAFPYLTAGQRELMLSNTCDTCWNKFFPMYVRNFEEEDDDEYNDLLFLISGRMAYRFLHLERLFYLDVTK